MESKEIKTAGIVCDNYKVTRFKKELEANGFTNYEVHPFLMNTSTIKVKLDVDKMKELAKLIKKTELSFHRSN